MLSKFREWNTNRHSYAKEWKERTGGKVLGYFCTYVPEEILYAANILPVRILGAHEPQDLTEQHIFGMYCPFCRDCLAQGLKGRYDYLDGIMISQSCLHIRQAFTSWEKHIPKEFSYYMPMPNNVQSPHSVKYLAEEIRDFKIAVEGWIGHEITDADIKRGIEIMNENRSLIHEVYSFKKTDNPAISGEETMQVAITQQMVEKNEHSAALKELVRQLKTKGKDKNSGARLMVLGSENDDIPFINMVEECGATVVIDDHCVGTRYFWNNVVPTDGDPILDIAQRYIDRPACPSKDWIERNRVAHVVNLAKNFNAQGAILIQQKFCDPHELDIPAIRKAFGEIGIPTLFLEFDVTVPIGQFKIRVEAFLEMLNEDELF